MKNLGQKLIKYSLSALKNFQEIFIFFLLLNCFFINQLFSKITNINKLPTLIKQIVHNCQQIVLKVMNKLDRGSRDSISQTEIIQISLENMFVKTTRTAITVGGMSIAIAVIVFLVSIGYGLQDLVVSRVSKLEEMQQTDVTTGDVGNLFINDESLNVFSGINHVKAVYPIISLVGKVSIKESATEVVINGVTSDYLKNSALKTSKGYIFENKDTTQPVADKKLTLTPSQNVEPDINVLIGEVEFYLDQNQWLAVREEPQNNATIIGYTQRINSRAQNGEEVWGESYNNEETTGQASESATGQKLGKWIKSEVALWEKTACDESNSDCINGQYLMIRDNSQQQLKQIGYLTENKLTAYSLVKPLGAETNNTINENQSQSIDDQIKELTSQNKEEVSKTEKIKLSDEAQKEIIVNNAMVQLLGENLDSILNKEIEITFIVTSDLTTGQQNKKVESFPAKYKVIGIINNGTNAMAWVPFTDLRSLGINNYSSARVILDTDKNLTIVRTQIENMGYKTNSVADTVTKIKNLFTTFRITLAAIGMASLGVAALGMFNTLTISLLERTREVGVMKAIGMKSREVRDLFLSESMIMGFMSGILGIIIGFVAGKVTGLLLSVFSLTKGYGLLNITSLPLSFILIIMFLSITVGFVTGIYPANRAKKVSALNAVRYE